MLYVMLRGNLALLTSNVALLKFMGCVLDFQLRIYLDTDQFSGNLVAVHQTLKSTILMI